MIRKVRQAALLSLLGICLAGIATPRVLWSQKSAPTAKEEDPNRELMYKSINFVILVVALVYILRKPMADFLSSRSASITKGLDEGRKALEASQAQMKEVEAKLSRLESEIAAFKASAESDMATERERLKQLSAEEAARMMESARAQAESMVRAAKLELKNYAAAKAVALAEEMIRARLDPSAQRRLVTQFVAKIDSPERKN